MAIARQIRSELSKEQILQLKQIALQRGIPLSQLTAEVLQQWLSRFGFVDFKNVRNKAKSK